MAYTIDPLRSVIRAFGATAQVSGRFFAMDPLFGMRVLVEAKEDAERDLYDRACRELNESESWVRAFSVLAWQDKSENTIDGKLWVGALYVDVGGVDGQPSIYCRPSRLPDYPRFGLL